MNEEQSLDLDKPDLVIAYCQKCGFSIEQPNGGVLEDNVLESEVQDDDGHDGKFIKLWLRRPLVIRRGKG